MKVEKVLEDGAYEAKLVNVEQRKRPENKFGDRLMWTFAVAGESTEVVGFTSMSPSTKAKPYQLAAAVAGEIDPKLGWGPEDLIGGECVVVLEAAEDAQGTEKNKVVRVKLPRKDKLAAAEREADSAGGETWYRSRSRGGCIARGVPWLPGLGYPRLHRRRSAPRRGVSPAILAYEPVSPIFAGGTSDAPLGLASTCEGCSVVP